MNTVALPEMRAGEIGVCLATTIADLARYEGATSGYNSPEISYSEAQAQLIYYRILEKQGKVRVISDWESLDEHVQEWNEQGHEDLPIGLILDMEGADPILSPRDVEEWWNQDIRAISLCHGGLNPYSHGTHSQGGLTPKGRKLLENMDSKGMILDVTHFAEEAFWEALDHFKGPLLASHNNCRALVPGDRQFSDEQLKVLFKRDAVIGVAFDNWMLNPGFIRRRTRNISVDLGDVVDHIDHICKLAGNTRHVAIGSDLDGGYGREQSPHDLDTIADLKKIPDLLRKRRYGQRDIEQIMHGNWLRLFHNSWT
jgi:membrane dipeptidase